MLAVVALAVFGTVAACVAYLVLSRFGPMEWAFRKELRQGAELIDSIEAFRRQNGRLPTEAEADRLLRPFQPYGPMGCPCYRVETPGLYILWFQGRSVGDSLKYDSATREWREVG
jgi:hypothetical protein